MAKAKKKPTKKAATKKPTPKLTDAGEKVLDDYWQRMQKEEAERATALAAFQKAFSADDTINVSTILGQYLQDGKCGALALQWTAEKFWAMRMPAMMDQLNRIYDELVRRKISSEKKSRDFNDGDDRVWYERHNSYKVVCHTTQNYNFLYVWEKDDDNRGPGAEGGLMSGRGMRRLNVRRFYDRFDDPKYDRANDKFEKEEDEEFKKGVAKEGRAFAIREMWRIGDYADDGTQYPKRLSLDAYRKAGFEMDYGDARDPGYILSWDEFGQKVDDAIHHHTMLDHLEECFIPGMIYTLFEEDKE
jgi:hypothetical protein